MQQSQFGYVNRTKGHERMAARGTRHCGTGTTTTRKHVNIQIKSAIECASKCHRILHSDLWLPAIQDGKFIALHLALSQASEEQGVSRSHSPGHLRLWILGCRVAELFVSPFSILRFTSSNDTHRELTQNSCQMPGHKAKWGSV